MRRDIGQKLPGLAERFITEFLGVVVDLEGLRVEAVCLMDGAADEIAARTALVGTVIDELARIGLDPGDERVPGFRRVGRLQLGRVIGEQNLATAVRQAVFAFDGKRIDLRIVGKTGSLDIGVNAGLDGAGRQKSVGGFEIVGLRIGIGLLGGDGSPIAMMPAPSPASTRLSLRPGLAASNAGLTMFVQKSRMLVSELVYQSIWPLAAKLMRGARARPAAAPAADIIKVRRFIFISDSVGRVKLGTANSIEI